MATRQRGSTATLAQRPSRPAVPGGESPEALAKRHLREGHARIRRLDELLVRLQAHADKHGRFASYHSLLATGQDLLATFERVYRTMQEHSRGMASRRKYGEQGR